MSKKFSGAIVVFLILGVLFSNKVLFAKSTKAVGKQLSPKELKLAEAEQELKDTVIQYKENKIKIKGLLANGKIEQNTAVIESLNGFVNVLVSLSKFMDAYEEYMDEFKDQIKEAQSFSEEQKEKFVRQIQKTSNCPKKIQNELMQNIIPESIILRKIICKFNVGLLRIYPQMLTTIIEFEEKKIDINEYLEDIGKTVEATADLCKSYKEMIKDYAINVKDMTNFIKKSYSSQ